MVSKVTSSYKRLLQLKSTHKKMGNVGLREFTLNLRMGGIQESSHVDKDDSFGLN